MQLKNPVRVTDLEGALLDYWVAHAEGLTPYIETAQRSTVQVCYLPPDFAAGNWYPVRYSPSSDWKDGGPIIERERINLQERGNCWQAHYSVGWSEMGETPLIATMRARVAAKFGEEVPGA